MKKPPDFLALVFEPEFMNSAGKEVLMDMAGKRHLLPVYRLNLLLFVSPKQRQTKKKTYTLGPNFTKIPSEWTPQCPVQGRGVFLELHDR